MVRMTADGLLRPHDDKRGRCGACSPFERSSQLPAALNTLFSLFVRGSEKKKKATRTERASSVFFKTQHLQCLRDFFFYVIFYLLLTALMYLLRAVSVAAGRLSARIKSPRIKKDISLFLRTFSV